MAVLAAALAPVGATGAGSAEAAVEALSTLPQYVSGGNVLVEVRVPESLDNFRIERNGDDVTSRFRAMPDGSLRGLVEGLELGENRIILRRENKRGEPGGRAALLRVVNHPLSGPMFSGPQQQPFFCETVQNGLGPALDANCFAPTQVRYHYRTSGNTFATLADPTVKPADLAQTTTIDGRTVDYIVRVEKGVIDRAVYEIAALHDPAAPPSPLADEPGWNGRLVYTFGGGCNVGYHQGQGNGGVLTDLFLARGYAVASSSLNVYDNNCSEVISAEAALMVKEHFAETYGKPVHTIGWGGSGGAIQQHLIGNNYPGILDGIVPGASFQDSITLGTVPDCRLLALYFASPAGIAAGWTAAQQSAASGFGSWTSCLLWHLAFASRTNALEACPGAVPPAARYHPVANPGGIKCTSFEQIATQLGRNPANGFAWRPLDNIGLQYGLTALQSGAITPEQFVSLNENAGGFDFIGNVVPQRVEADPIGIERGYETARVNTGGLGLASTPIIDLRQYTDFAPPFGGDIHTRVHSFVMRQRLLDANGTFANQVMLVADAAGAGLATVEALTQMEAWLTAIGADDAPGKDAQRVIRNRPASLTDACWAGATKVAEPFGILGGATCAVLYPTFAETRMVAGSPLAGDVFKCQLKPLNVADYGVTFTADQQARLAATFPTGVCDWRKRGVDQRTPRRVWLDYGS
jgi:hypothetical protein